MEYMKDIVVDLSNETYFNYINAVQGDSGSRFVRVIILNNSVQYIPDEETTAILRCKKPDGTFILNDGEITQDGAIIAELTENMLSSVGLCRCEISLYKDGSCLSSAPFIVKVLPGAVDENFVKSNEYKSLLAAITKVEDFGSIISSSLKEATEAVDKLDEFKEGIEEAIGSAQTAAESAQGAAEDAKDEAEKANAATAAAIVAINKANTAAEAANNASGLANQAADNAAEATEEASQAAGNANTAAENANAVAQAAETAKQGANTAAGNANAAAESATSAAEEAKEAAAFYGSPLVATTAGAMTNTKRVYVYTGSETGYISGHWYYHNGSGWVNGGVYNSTVVDGCIVTDTDNNKSYFMKFRIANGKPVIVYDEV